MIGPSTIVKNGLASSLEVYARNCRSMDLPPAVLSAVASISTSLSPAIVIPSAQSSAIAVPLHLSSSSVCSRRMCVRWMVNRRNCNLLSVSLNPQYGPSSLRQGLQTPNSFGSLVDLWFWLRPCPSTAPSPLCGKALVFILFRIVLSDGQSVARRSEQVPVSGV